MTLIWLKDERQNSLLFITPEGHKAALGSATPGMAPGHRVAASGDCWQFVWQAGWGWLGVHGSGSQRLSLVVWYLALGPFMIEHSGPGCENLIRRVVGVWTQLTAQESGAEWPGPHNSIQIALRQQHPLIPLCFKR